MQIVDEATLAARLSALPPNPRVVANGSIIPWEIVRIVDENVPEYRLYMLNAQAGIPVREGVVHESAFVGPGMRGLSSLRYYPARLSLAPRMFATKLPPDLVVVHVSRVQGDTVSLGAEVNVLPDAIEAARARGAMVIAQINEKMPYTFGDSVIPCEHIDLAIEASQDLHVFDPAPLNDESTFIGQTIADRIPDGATLQTGIGAMPDAVLSSLLDRKGLGVWTELMSDGSLALERAGALDPDRLIVCSFLLGTQELYEWVDNNPRVRVMRASRTNDPGLISQQPAMTSINTALQVDLFGQANASRIKHKIYSGTGGQTDFIVGAMHSPGGHAYLALRSWHPRANVSTIVAKLEEATTSMQMSAVVTEQGLADLYCKTQEEQAEELIAHAAHPDARDGLRDEAVRLGLLAG